MAGITSYGAYIPYHRLTAGRGAEVAVGHYDEDPITMAVAAGIDCLNGTNPRSIDAVYLATTTAPFLERLNSNIVALGLDVKRDARNADFGNTLRVGVAALLAAKDAVDAGSMDQVLVTVADSRQGGANFGDGAAAFLVGRDSVAVEIEGTYTYSDDLVDNWRGATDTTVRSWEERFGRDAGYLEIPKEVVSGLLEKLNLTVKDVSKLCLYGATSKVHKSLVKGLGFAAEQVQDPLVDSIGNTGAALAPMILVSALEDAKPGDRILMVTWGNGCDAVMLKATDQITKIKDRRAIKRHLAMKGSVDFGKAQTWRKAGGYSGGISNPAQWRERRLAVPLYGVKCRKCGTPQLYMTGSSMRAHICLECQEKDNFDPYRFADKKGKVVTFSHDFLGGGIDPPMTRSVIDFEGGGRGIFDTVDRDPDECKVGMEVEMTFRTTGGYFWKCKPIRE